MFYKLFNFAEPAARAGWIMLQVFEDDVLHKKDSIRVDGPGPWHMFLTDDVRVKYNGTHQICISLKSVFTVLRIKGYGS